MTSIETYQERIATIKASIDALKRSPKLIITRLDSGEYEVEQASDLELKHGTVIADSAGRVYLRVARGIGGQWRAAVGVPEYRSHESLLAVMRQRASWGTTYRFLNETGQDERE